MNTVVAFDLNGHQVRVEAKPHRRLLDVLRTDLGQTGTKEGCGEGECGACTVLIDGRAVNSCLLPVAEAAGSRVTTVEGLAPAPGDLSPLQQAFLDEDGTQCGFCTPGMVMAARALLTSAPNPTESEIRRALVGNLCRCTGYVQIVAAIRSASDLSRAAP